MCAGEEIAGRIECAPNARNPRDLDITLAHSFVGRHMQVRAEQVYRLR